MASLVFFRVLPQKDPGLPMKPCLSRLWWSLVIVVLLPALTRADDALRAEFEKVIDAPRYLQASWGILVVDLDSGKSLYERNADRLFAPASVTKLFSVATALDAFGKDYRF